MVKKPKNAKITKPPKTKVSAESERIIKETTKRFSSALKGLAKR